MNENLSEILDRAAAAAYWQRDKSERMRLDGIAAHDGTGDFASLSDSVRAWFEGNALGISGARRDAANILDSLAVALAALIGTEVPDGAEANARLLAKARERITAEEAKSVF